jgi:TPR repeat protein
MPSDHLQAVVANPPDAHSAAEPQQAPVEVATAAVPRPQPPNISTTTGAQGAAMLPPQILSALVKRGDAMLAVGDVSSARRLYTRAAESDDVHAATQLGKTYDPLFLAEIGARGMLTDSASAEKWYRKAMALGDVEAAERLKRLVASGQ